MRGKAFSLPLGVSLTMTYIYYSGSANCGINLFLFGFRS